MRLNKIQIKNFRSIIDSGRISTKDLMVLIGKNNAGKSNFLKALDLFFNGYKPSYDDFPVSINTTKCNMQIKLQFAEVEPTIQTALGLTKDRFTFTKTYPLRNRKVKAASLHINKTSYKKIEEFSTKSEFKEYMTQRLPTFYYLPALRDISDEGKWKRNSLIRKILKDSFKDPDIIKCAKNIQQIVNEQSKDVEQQVNAILQDRIEDFDQLRISFEDMDPMKMFTPTLEVKNKPFDSFLDVIAQGAGTQNFIILALAQYNANREDPTDLIVAFEEPEISLHCRAQRRMLDTIKTILKQNDNQQIILTTHSTIFIDNSIENIYTVKKVEGNSLISPFDQQELIESLGIRGSDSFLNDALVFVEGRTDYVVFTEFTNYMDVFNDLEVTFLQMSGLWGMKDFRKEDYRKLTTQIFCIIDSDKESPQDKSWWLNKEVQNKIKEQLGGGLHVLERRALENYFTYGAVRDAYPLGEHVMDRHKFEDDFAEMKDHLTEIIREHDKQFYTQQGNLDLDRNERREYNTTDARRIAQKMVKRNEIPQEFHNIFQALERLVKKATE